MCLYLNADDGVRARSMHLPLGKVKRSSGGKYECIADNDVSLPVKHLIQLTVNCMSANFVHYNLSSDLYLCYSFYGKKTNY